MVRGVDKKSAENIKIESKFCLIHIRELFLMKKWGNIEMKIESNFEVRLNCPRALHFTLLPLKLNFFDNFGNSKVLHAV